MWLPASSNPENLLREGQARRKDRAGPTPPRAVTRRAGGGGDGDHAGRPARRSALPGDPGGQRSSTRKGAEEIAQRASSIGSTVSAGPISPRGAAPSSPARMAGPGTRAVLLPDAAEKAARKSRGRARGALPRKGRPPEREEIRALLGVEAQQQRRRQPDRPVERGVLLRQARGRGACRVGAHDQAPARQGRPARLGQHEVDEEPRRLGLRRRPGIIAARLRASV